MVQDYISDLTEADPEVWPSILLTIYGVRGMPEMESSSETKDTQLAMLF